MKSLYSLDCLNFLSQETRAEVIENIRKNDLAHQEEHVLAVVELANELADVVGIIKPTERRRLLTAAFMHDIACHENRTYHHLIGGIRASVILLRNEQHIFTPEDIEEIRVLIAEHRASYSGPRSSVASQVLRLADMGRLDSERFGIRAIEHRYGQMSKEFALQETADYLISKFAPDGYAWITYPALGQQLYMKEIAVIKSLCADRDKLIAYLDDVYAYVEKKHGEIMC